jgi:hypothetical protein
MTTTLKTSNLAQTATRLGWAGLLPFVAAPVALYGWAEQAALVGSAIAAYALAILCFLAGAWWGIALLRSRPVILVASNLMVIIACLGFVLLDLRATLLLLAVLLLGTVGVERLSPMFRPQPPYYAALRMRLSGVACVSLVLSAWVLGRLSAGLL